jgi:hypothetical protein
MVQTGRLLARGELAWPRERMGMRIGFADGTSAVVFRETVRRGALARDPCILVVEFRLRWLRGWTHALFRAESICNTPLFAGFPGLISKLWLAHDQHDVYRGLYEWDGAERAEHYARSLWRVLAIGSVRGSIHYTIIPGASRADVLPPPEVTLVGGAHEWWRVTTATSATRAVGHASGEAGGHPSDGARNASIPVEERTRPSAVMRRTS